MSRLVRSHNTMATQQQGAPSRPWFRLATMVRPPPTQQPAPAPPPPRPPIMRPTFTQVPPPAVVAPTPSPVPPVAKATPSPPFPKEPHPVATPTSSPPRTISRPPSPLVLPSPQLRNTYQPEYEQQTMLMQETKEAPNGRRVGWGPHSPESNTIKKKSDSDDVRMRIITIAGENKGAIMDLTPFTHNLAGNINPTPSSDGDSNSEGKSKAKKEALMSAIMNSNVQGVNNSILYNCSTSHHDPGVHLSFSRKPRGFNAATK